MNFTINQWHFKDLQKLLKYYSGTAIFTFLNNLSSAAAIDSPMKLDLYLKDVELAVKTLSEFPSLFIGDLLFLNCHKLPQVSE